MIASVDFLDPELDRVLEKYASMGRVRCVRQHLGWHPTNPALRFATRPDLLSDDAWRGRIAALRGRGLVCELEVFGSQLWDLAAVAVAYSDIQFVLPVMGWPLDLTEDGQKRWRRALAALSACSNVAVKIFAMECIFGVRWTVPQVRPWILETIEIFGPSRCMFASHMPICTLACSIQQLYDAYFEIIADFSVFEKCQLLHDTAANVYRIP
jgi:predicted TIM-barrel fold metal-dependent hydrolase